MNDTIFGELGVIAMKGCEEFGAQVDYYLKDWRGRPQDETFLVKHECPRFGSGEGKGIIYQSMRGHDLYIICDVFNHGVTYEMFGKTVPMSPDDHFVDLKRIISAIAGKARRVSVIMPMLYEGRQDKRQSRESLDCAMMLQELYAMGVANIITFDAHDSRVQNAIPLCGFDSVRPAYQMIKALVRNVPDILIDKNNLMIISPDEGAMGRCIYYASVLGIDVGMFHKRRDYTRVVNGRNPIISHEYLGTDPAGMDVIIVDDIISSGDSLIEVAQQIKAKGAKRIFAFVTFGLFTDGIEKINRAYQIGLIDKIFTTNLVYRTPELLAAPWYCEVNMCKYVAYIIDTLNHDGSISNLLNPVQRIHNLVERHMSSIEGSQMTMKFEP
ncbi:MAG TPA: ribose-phosphate pyrophosphokinase [Bacillota bacterium]|nr:ribose-phosphate pyrophosphokinase [Bacillota bacterium]